MLPPPPPPPPPPPVMIPLQHAMSADSINQLNDSGKYISTSLSNLSFSKKQKLVKEMFDRRKHPPPAVEEMDSKPKPQRKKHVIATPSDSESSATESSEPPQPKLRKKKQQQQQQPILLLKKRASKREKAHSDDQSIDDGTDSNSIVECAAPPPPLPPKLPSTLPVQNPVPVPEVVIQPQQVQQAPTMVTSQLNLIPSHFNASSESQTRLLMHHAISSFEQCLHHTLDTLLVSQLNTKNMLLPVSSNPSTAAAHHHPKPYRPQTTHNHEPIQKINDLVNLVKMNTDQYSKTFQMNMDALELKNQCIKDSKLTTLIDLLDSVYQ